jgi:phosphotransferase family enzyme
MRLPSSVLASLTGSDASRVRTLVERPLPGATGAATRGLTHVAVEIEGSAGTGRFDVVRKEFQALRTGPHRHGAEDPRHWAYWERELLAYASGLLPCGPGLRVPRCYGVDGDAVYLEHVGDTPVEAAAAARQLGEWQRTSTLPAVPWLGGHQLAQRVEASNLDWAAVDADPRAARLWDGRAELLADLERLPHVLSHGDFHLGNLRAGGSGDTIALDWGTLGCAPAGADLAHLALSGLRDLLGDYLGGLGEGFAARAVAFGYRATLVLVGASRVHWMVSRGVPVPDGYVDFLWDSRPWG